MRIDVWSDIACPWCYVGKRHLESALAQFGEAQPDAEVEVVFRSFELDPQAPAEREGDYVQMLASKYRASHDKAQAMLDQMTMTGFEAGLDLRFDKVRPGSTFDAHRLLHLGRARGLGAEVKERLMRAYLTEGVLMSDLDELRRLGVEAGLDDDEVSAVLSADTYGEDVRTEEETAYELGCSGVPFFVVDRAYAINGAQPAERILEVLQTAHAEARQTVPSAAGPADSAHHEHGPDCSGGTCAI
ncbi:DsbA family oxidoreductase [Nocardioidaceae bacterium]|nr:DsbA family oxidoreductase [Nocardioidaceae bacterium]